VPFIKTATVFATALWIRLAFLVNGIIADLAVAKVSGVLVADQTGIRLILACPLLTVRIGIRFRHSALYKESR